MGNQKYADPACINSNFKIIKAIYMIQHIR
jgi:hypothetical protein